MSKCQKIDEKIYIQSQAQFYSERSKLRKYEKVISSNPAIVDEYENFLKSELGVVAKRDQVRFRIQQFNASTEIVALKREIETLKFKRNEELVKSSNATKSQVSDDLLSRVSEFGML